MLAKLGTTSNWVAWALPFCVSHMHCPGLLPAVHCPRTRSDIKSGKMRRNLGRLIYRCLAASLPHCLVASCSHAPMLSCLMLLSVCHTSTSKCPMLYQVFSRVAVIPPHPWRYESCVILSCYFLPRASPALLCLVLGEFIFQTAVQQYSRQQ